MKSVVNYIKLSCFFALSALNLQGYSQLPNNGVLEINVEPNKQVVIRLGNYIGELQWQKSKDFVLWLDIPNATTDTLFVIADSTRYFRARVTFGECEPFYSDTTLIRVIMPIHGMYQPCPGIQTVKDIDGNEYPTVLIGNQCWMAENLIVSRYNNGDPIPTGYSNTSWARLNQGAYAIFPHGQITGINSGEEMKEFYGKLYNWHAVSDPRGLCPPGWRPPENNDFVDLIKFIGGSSWAGSKLKSCLQVFSPLGHDCDRDDHPRWDFSCGFFGVDTYGFSALPAGSRSWQGRYADLGSSGSFWSLTERPSVNSYAFQYSLYVSRNSSSSNLNPKYFGGSVRCIRIID